MRAIGSVASAALLLAAFAHPVPAADLSWSRQVCIPNKPCGGGWQGLVAIDPQAGSMRFDVRRARADAPLTATHTIRCLGDPCVGRRGGSRVAPDRSSMTARFGNGATCTFVLDASPFGRTFHCAGPGGEPVRDGIYEPAPTTK